MRELQRSLAYCERYGTEASLAFFDMDGFKAVNDSFGHAAGDAALQWVAARLAAHVRESDLVGRMGGDEFAVMLAHANISAAERKARRLVEAIERDPVVFDGHPIPLRISVGRARPHPRHDRRRADGRGRRRHVPDQGQPAEIRHRHPRSPPGHRERRPRRAALAARERGELGPRVRPRMRIPLRPSRAGDDVRRDLVLDADDLVAQGQLLLLEAGDADLVRLRAGLQRLDGGVEVFMLDAQLSQPDSGRGLIGAVSRRIVVHRYPSAGAIDSKRRPRVKQIKRRRFASRQRDLTGRSAGDLVAMFFEWRQRPMAIEARIRELGNRHYNLEKAIEDELNRPQFDTLRVKELKRQKLHLKEQIETLRGAHAHH